MTTTVQHETITVPPRLDGSINQPVIDLLNRIHSTSQQIRRLAVTIKAQMDNTLEYQDEANRQKFHDMDLLRAVDVGRKIVSRAS